MQSVQPIHVKWPEKPFFETDFFPLGLASNHFLREVCEPQMLITLATKFICYTLVKGYYVSNKGIIDKGKQNSRFKLEISNACKRNACIEISLETSCGHMNMSEFQKKVVEYGQGKGFLYSNPTLPLNNTKG